MKNYLFNAMALLGLAFLTNFTPLTPPPTLT